MRTLRATEPRPASWSLFTGPILTRATGSVSCQNDADKRLIAHYAVEHSSRSRGDAEGEGVISIDTRGQRDSPRASSSEQVAHADR